MILWFSSSPWTVVKKWPPSQNLVSTFLLTCILDFMLLYLNSCQWEVWKMFRVNLTTMIPHILCNWHLWSLILSLLLQILMHMQCKSNSHFPMDLRTVAHYHLNIVTPGGMQWSWMWTSFWQILIDCVLKSVRWTFVWWSKPSS